MERLLVHHVANGDRDRFDYTVAYLVDRPDSLVTEFEDLEVECVHLSSSSSANPRWVSRLRKLVRDRQIDVVHAHSPYPAAMARGPLRLMKGGPSLVYTEHNTWDCYSPATRAANAVTFGLDHAQFAVSEDALASVPRLLRGRAEVLTHGIDLEGLRAEVGDPGQTRVRLGIAPGQVVVTNLAHLRAEKAQEDLLRAAADVITDHPEVVFLSVGHGPRREELERLHSNLGLGEQFRFLGFRDDAAAILGASDVFCISSRQEGRPLALMESMALGLPTVSTRAGGIPDHVVDGESGILVEPGDVAGLSRALKRVVSDAALRSRLGRAAAHHAEVFDARVAVEHQETVYARLRGGVNVRHSGGGR
ncbi:MAG: glycosyltransferase [Propioniciclava sp.]